MIETHLLQHAAMAATHLLEPAIERLFKGSTDWQVDVCVKYGDSKYQVSFGRITDRAMKEVSRHRAQVTQKNALSSVRGVPELLKGRYSEEFPASAVDHLVYVGVASTFPKNDQLVANLFACTTYRYLEREVQRLQSVA